MSKRSLDESENEHDNGEPRRTHGQDAVQFTQGLSRPLEEKKRHR